MLKDARGSDRTDTSDDFFADFAREALGLIPPSASFDGGAAPPDAVDLPEDGFNVLLATGALPFENHAPLVDGHVAYDPSLDSDPHNLAATDGAEIDLAF
ncbi:hypothetical protein AADZ90_013400 [Aestuariibius sp. 2305UL40-4]|uniref:hypothetical protein n=1 Tax=Aestuariibius violaceus TaxID=3234132 RepID=UPI00345E40E4